jgi:hypothetical protein
VKADLDKIFQSRTTAAAPVSAQIQPRSHCGQGQG